MFVFFFSGACMSMHARYQADIEFSEKGQIREAEFVYERTIDTTGHMIACILTGVIYGGWCWYYTMMPDGSQRAELYSHANRALDRKMKGRKFDVTREWTNKVYWGTGPVRQDLEFITDTDPYEPKK